MTTTKVSPARRLAWEVLMRVEKDGAYAARALSAALARERVATRDRALATELVYGVLRHRATIDYYMGRFSSKPLNKLSLPCREALRLAGYQAMYLSAVPGPVACSESVALVKTKQPWAAGYVNAVCRSFLRGYADVTLPDPQKDPVAYVATKYSHPRWLVAKWIRQFGFDATESMCETNLTSAPMTVRVNTTKTTRDHLMTLFEQRGLRVRPGRWSKHSVIVEGGGSVASWPGYDDGLFQVQDESSQQVAEAVDPRPGQRIVDLCAAPGGKTTHIAERLVVAAGDRQDTVTPVRAYDVHAHKIRLIESNAQRLGLNGIIEATVQDASKLPAYEDDRWDTVLLDAPCTGTGVLRRRHDLKWRLHRDDVTALVEKQRALLSRAARLVRPGGMLIYATCSVEPEENEENARWFLKTFPNFVPQPFTPDNVDHPAFSYEGGPGLRLMPIPDGPDGFYILKLQRLSNKT